MIMFKEIFVFLIISIHFCQSTNFAWNTNKPFKYSGFIYTDSSIAVISPVLQVKLKNDEEVCNFQLTKSDYNSETLDYNPFRAVVKSAHLGIGEIELLPNINLNNLTNANINLIIVGQACHDPDSWTEPAEISIKVIDPPEPLWTKSSYTATINNDAIIGSHVVKVNAYLPPSADPDNKICKYHIENSQNSPFAIDGSGTISTQQNLLNSDVTLAVLDIIAEDCSLPTHRQSKVKVFVTITPICNIGWTGFYKVFQYLSGSGVTPIGKKLEFQFCNKNPENNLNQIIENCKLKKKFRVTVSIEFKDLFLTSSESSMNDNNICYLDYKSLKLQRKICDINDNKVVDLLTLLSKQKTGVIKFPIETNMFPGLSMAEQEKFSLLFWMLRKTPERNSDEFIVCHLHESGDILFSVLISFCNLRIYLNSSLNMHIKNPELFLWEYNLSTVCDNKWHHYLLQVQRSRDRTSHEINVLIDGESVEHKIMTPVTGPLDFVVSPINENYNFFIGQSTRTAKRNFRGYMAGFIYLPDIIVKSSSARCLMKCMERLHFNGMNEMNPGMSVSLNSEMQTIIINGHNVEEVGKLVEDVGYANPKWNPIPGPRKIVIKTDMLCNKLMINVPSVNVTVNVSKQDNVVTHQKLINSITISSKSTEITIDNIFQIRSNTGVGLGLFSNAVISVNAIPLSTSETLSEESLTISRCIVSVHPELVKTEEYFDWPQQALDTLSSENNSIKVTNNSKKIIFFGDFNYQLYQFIIQHLKYFGSYIPTFNRQFQLQCSSDVGMEIIDSNILVVKIKSSSVNKAKLKYSRNVKIPTNVETPINVNSKYLVNESQKPSNILMHMRAHSNVAKIKENSQMNSERLTKPTKTYSYFLVIGIVILICSFAFMVKKFQKAQKGHNYYLPFKVIDCICLPLQSIRERIKPTSLVRVELSRDYLNRASAKRREISLEMQWDDTELKSNRKYHIIENPIYEKSGPEFDDNYLNNDIPPICEKEDLTTDDETDDENDYHLNMKDSQHEESIMKKRLIDL